MPGSLGSPAAPASWLGSMLGVAGEELAQHVAELVVRLLVVPVRIVGRCRPLQPPFSRVASTLAACTRGLGGKWPRLGARLSARREQRAKGTPVALFTDDDLQPPLAPRRAHRAVDARDRRLVILAVAIVVDARPRRRARAVRDRAARSRLQHPRHRRAIERRGAMPLISIPGEKTYPTEGSLDLLTVSVVGNREHPAELVRGRAAPGSTRARRCSRSTPSSRPASPTEQSQQPRTRPLMVNSQQDAIAAALDRARLRLPAARVTVEAAHQGHSGRRGVLEVGDEIIAVNGEPVARRRRPCASDHRERHGASPRSSASCATASRVDRRRSRPTSVGRRQRRARHRRRHGLRRSRST